MAAAVGTPNPVEPVLLELREAAARDRRRTGTKAATLASLLQTGFPVPDGFVITADALSALGEDGDGDVPATDDLATNGAATNGPTLPRRVLLAVCRLAEHYAGTRLAVRSSALAEDLTDASFAGQYETVLDVTGIEALTDAVLRCRASAGRVEAGAYRAWTQAGQGRGTAVLVQRLVVPDVAGVAFGADPITGDSTKVVVSAVRGNGACLVSGEVAAEDWEVTTEAARRRNADTETLSPDEARAVAEILRRVERLLGHPQDLEWAIAGGELFVLQARPMTALPMRAEWRPPLRGGWFRGIRLGELLPEPVTPLFESWLLDRLERQFGLHQATEGGFAAPAPAHVLVNGWYFHSPIGAGRQTLLLRGLVRRPRLAMATLVASRWSDLADRIYFGALARRWRTDVLSRYQTQVADVRARIVHADAADLVRAVDELAGTAGDFYWSLVLFGGAAWRSEVALARFWRRNLATVVDSYQVLVCGLNAPATPDHAVHSLDWIRETRSELSEVIQPMSAPHRHDALVAERAAAEAACWRALASRPRLRARFAMLLGIARHYAAIRDEHGSWFTLAWPLMRGCVQRLGEHLRVGGALERAEDVFFLVRSELDACLRDRVPDGLATAVRERRFAWQGQRLLTPPLVLGRPSFLLAKFLLAPPRFLRPSTGAPSGTLHGTPASPGIATGRARILLDPTAVAEVRQGDVLVVSAAAPALTSLFDRAVALCVDSGSVAAHASLIAREYGIPAVVGLGDATARLSEGALVTVDGGTGVVRVR